MGSTGRNLSIVFSSLQSLHVDESIYLVHWLEIDSENQTVKHANNESVNVRVFRKFIIINIDGCEQYEFQTVGAPFFTEGKILFSNAGEKNSSYHDIFVQKNRIDVFYIYNHEFGIVQESFNVTGYRIYGPVSRQNFVIDAESEVVPDSRPVPGKKGLPWIIESRERFKVGVICGTSIPCNSSRFLRDPRHTTTVSTNKMTSCTKEGPKGDLDVWSCEKVIPYSSTSKFILEFNNSLHNIVTYNGVWNDELLIMRSEGHEKFCLNMFDSSHQSYEPVLFATLDYPRQPKGHFFMNDNYNICFHMAWLQKRDLKSLIKCYPREFLIRKKQQFRVGQQDKLYPQWTLADEVEDL
ncbi:hypothetical protein QAD02_011536 [Eretmocerus hayati]|uniref:Uncharacterized protein n=1 Tax=Eretmocerus hayati TaxID=131215 RepID=A0ACC2P1U6_9HYME|nr:hypothetical protein QAD02_011536 [Eretmocerus hayati]